MDREELDALKNASTEDLAGGNASRNSLVILKLWVAVSEPGDKCVFTDEMVQKLNGEGEATSAEFNEYIQAQHDQTVTWELSSDGRDYHFTRIQEPDRLTSLYENGPDARAKATPRLSRPVFGPATAS